MKVIKAGKLPRENCSRNIEVTRKEYLPNLLEK